MNRKKDLKLSIPKPCSQEWDRMTTNNSGRHCDSCQKTVVDFSNFTDKELIEFFKKATGKICGRLNPYQVNRPIPIIEQSQYSLFQKALFGTAIVAGIATNANGQAIKQVIPPVQAPVPTEPSIKMGQVCIIHKERHSLSGVVKDSKSKQPIKNAEVFLDRVENIVYTDSTGAFELDVPDSLIGGKIIVVFSSEGHASVEKEISATNFPKKMNIAMKPRKMEPFMGDIVY
jgi:hypothetical protein